MAPIFKTFFKYEVSGFQLSSSSSNSTSAMQKFASRKGQNEQLAFGVAILLLHRSLSHREVKSCWLMTPFELNKEVRMRGFAIVFLRAKNA